VVFDKVAGSAKPGLLGGKGHKEDRPFRFTSSSHSPGDFEENCDTAGIVIGTVVNFACISGIRIRPAAAEVIVMGGDDNALPGISRIATRYSATIFLRSANCFPSLAVKGKD
jgi:hypothetical protein